MKALLKYWDFIFYGIVFVACVFLGGIALADKLTAPDIYEIEIETVRDAEGGWLLVYRYAIDGVESVVFLEDDKELEVYKRYLESVGRFYDNGGI